MTSERRLKLAAFTPRPIQTETNRWNSAGLVEAEGSTPVPPAKGPSVAAAMAEVVAFHESAEQVASPLCMTSTVDTLLER